MTRPPAGPAAAGRPRFRPSVLLPAALMAVAVFAAGCSDDPAAGYTFESPHPAGIRSVAVPIWQRGKDVYRRGLEDRLTEAIRKQILLDTPYRVTGRDRADTLLTGTIDEVIQRTLSTNVDTGRPGETELTLVLSFQWTDLRSGKNLRQRKNFRVTTTYLPSRPFSEDFFQGSEDAFNRAARRVVESMERDW
jgi:hypothetical protein